MTDYCTLQTDTVEYCMFVTHTTKYSAFLTVMVKFYLLNKFHLLNKLLGPDLQCKHISVYVRLRSWWPSAVRMHQR